MAILPILTEPDSRLREVSKPVLEVTDEIRQFMQDMLETMYDDSGIGLAAIQVGVAKQIIVLDLREDDPELKNRPEGFYPLFMVNPKIITASEECVAAAEGCLSVPSLRVEVSRPSSIKVEYLDYNGEQRTIDASGWFARAIQHEMDHLLGKLIIDYLSPLKKDMAEAKLKKIKKGLV
jgi:peptide deformylase